MIEFFKHSFEVAMIWSVKTFGIWFMWFWAGVAWLFAELTIGRKR